MRQGKYNLLRRKREERKWEGGMEGGERGDGCVRERASGLGRVGEGGEGGKGHRTRSSWTDCEWVGEH